MSTQSDRKILVSGGAGAGWSSWYERDAYDDARFERIYFMLTYEPFIEFLLNGGEFEEPNAPYDGGIHPRELVDQFLADWKEKFPGHNPPYLGGVSQLYVQVVPTGRRFCIDENHGSEYCFFEDNDEYHHWF